jgi:hypothetical protein
LIGPNLKNAAIRLVKNFRVELSKINLLHKVLHMLHITSM